MSAKNKPYCLAIAKAAKLPLIGKELNYGKGLGRADDYCVVKDWKTVIEIEISQRHPEMNVIKAWPYLINNTNEKIFLIQHITNTSAVSPNRIQLCNWIGQKMEIDLGGRFKYFLIQNKLTPAIIRQLKTEISKL